MRPRHHKNLLRMRYLVYTLCRKKMRRLRKTQRCDWLLEIKCRNKEMEEFRYVVSDAGLRNVMTDAT
jgi:hypothetical protein